MESVGMVLFFAVSVMVTAGLTTLAAGILVTRPIIHRYSVNQQPVQPLRFAIECLLVLLVIVGTMLASWWAFGMFAGWCFSTLNYPT